MKNFFPNLSGQNGPIEEAVQEGFYSVSEGLVTYHFKIEFSGSFSVPEGPFSVELPVKSKIDALIKNGAVFYNGGALTPMGLLLKSGEKKAFLSYTGPGGVETPMTETLPAVLVSWDTYFHSTGSYFCEE